jgi:hypothetical protein
MLKRSPNSFVWAAPTLLRGGYYLFIEDNSLRGENTVVDSNPARVKARGREVHTNYDTFKLIVVRMSIGTHTEPVQMITALNQEGVELRFNQSYLSELTTNPLGKH